jgi:hypothetical protein
MIVYFDQGMRITDWPHLDSYWVTFIYDQLNKVEILTALPVEMRVNQDNVHFVIGLRERVGTIRDNIRQQASPKEFSYIVTCWETSIPGVVDIPGFTFRVYYEKTVSYPINDPEPHNGKNSIFAMEYRVETLKNLLFIVNVNVHPDFQGKGIMKNINLKMLCQFFKAMPPNSLCAAQAWHIATWKLVYQRFPEHPIVTLLSPIMINRYQFDRKVLDFNKKTGKYEFKHPGDNDCYCERSLKDLLGDHRII